MSMDSDSKPVEMFFFPFVGGGHQIPMIDMARVFAYHGAKATIIATPKSALSFQHSINRDQNSGYPISIHILNLPDNVDLHDTTMSAGSSTDTSMLQEPLRYLLLEHRPDCVVHDMFHRWSPDVINSFNIPRITFSGHACFARCVQENIERYKLLENLTSDFEPFLVPGLPDGIEVTRSQLPGRGGFPRRRPLSDENKFGVLMNTFYDLEPAYADYFKNELGNKAWLVGPVSLCNRNVQDKAERGQKTSTDEESILSWLETKKPNSVLFISFGSIARLSPAQLLEIAIVLESSSHPFIWVVGKIFRPSDEDQEIQENWLPEGFQERIRESRKGLIIQGWAPQLLILEHPAVGGFMTHCGWNSSLEGITAGLPMITWPISAEQFLNEKLIVDVLKIGVKVGSKEWTSWTMEPPPPLGRDKVEAAVKRLMCGGDDDQEVAEMRRRVKELGKKARIAIEDGGSSYNDAKALIQELKSMRKID